MPIYEYKGLSAKGKPVTGILDADSPRVLKERLQRDGIFLSQYTETSRKGEKRTVGGQQAGSRDVRLGDALKRIKLIEVAEVTRQLATLVRSGIPLVEGLGAVSEQHENPKLKRVLSQVKRSVSEGSSLANALKEHPKVFTDLFVNMVGAGESSGNLDIVFERLADLTEAQVRLKAKLMGAMMYPIIMVFLGFGIVTLMMLFVVPKISEMFTEMGTELPMITKILIGTSEFFQTFWPLIFLGIFGGSAAFNKWRKTEGGRATWDRMVLKVPVFGRLIRDLSIARFSRTLSTLLHSGVPILTAMGIVKSIMSNETLAKVVEAAREAVKEGQSIAEPLKASKEFPPMVTHMISVGEKSGQLESMLGNVADSYDIQVESKIQQLTSALEPVMIVLMGLSVAFLVFAILMPMMDMNEAISSGGG